MYSLKSFFMVGIYSADSEYDEHQWTYHFESCMYLSKKYRICSHKSAAEFENPQQAREFFHAWKFRDKYKLRLVEYKTHIKTEPPKSEPGSPREILERIRTFESSSVHSTAFMWFVGQDIHKMWSANTIKKHNKILSKYNLDILSPPLETLQPLDPGDDNEWHLKTNQIYAVK